MNYISEKQLRKIRHLLFEAMEIQDHNLVNDVVKYVGLEPSSPLTKQLKAEYKTWKQLMNTNVKELRAHEKGRDTKI